MFKTAISTNLIVRNYIKSAHRNVLRNKVQSVIQILSLAIGLTVFTLVALYLYDELTVDRNIPHFRQVYRVETPELEWLASDVVPLPLGPEIEKLVPEISHMTRIRYNHSIPVAIPEEEGRAAVQITLDGGILVDSGFFNVFPQSFLYGDPEIVLFEPFQIILTHGTAEKLFPDENPLGKMVYYWNSVPYEVVGVIRDPVNTHLKFDAITPISNLYEAQKRNDRLNDKWHFFWQSYPCYVRLHNGVETATAEKKMKDVWAQYLYRLSGSSDEFNSDISLRPLAEVHVADIDPALGYMTHSNRKNLFNFFLLGLGILLLAVINYINLATARASMRSRELALRKINGSSRSSLILYLLTESVITTLFSFLIAATLAQLLFPSFNYLLQSDINLYFLRSPIAWIATLLIIFLVGIISGLYPAIHMSGEHPLNIFSGGQGKRRKGLTTRRVLMVIQFSSAVVLLYVIISMQQQIRFMKTQDLGFDREQVVHLGTGSLNNQVKIKILDRIKRIPEVEYACLSHPVPGLNHTDDINVVDDPESLFYGMELKVIIADLDFFRVYDLNFTQGAEILDLSSLNSYNRDTSENNSNNFFVINETCRKALGIDDPVGITTSGMGPGGMIVGVVEDFHFQSLMFPVKPMAIWLRTKGQPWTISVKFISKNIAKTLQKIESAYRNADLGYKTQPPRGVPHSPISIAMINETFDRQYEKVERLQQASTYLSILAVIIACLGLFGLSTFLAQRRIKEIGIRRALGASEGLVMRLLAKDFLKWVTISIFVGLPLGYLVMRQWQQQFAYRVDIGLWVYALTILIVYVVSLGTVAWQSLKAARSNPVDSLRTE